MGSSVRSWGLVVLAAAFLAAAQTLSFQFYRPALPVFERPVMERYALMDVSFVLAGLRRMGADLAFIQLLQYYARAEEEGNDHDGHDHEEGHYHVPLGLESRADLHPHQKLADFPMLITYALRGASLDPYFHYSYLFTAGALAFNLNRHEEALSLLESGSRRDPTFWRYRLYAGAIAFRKSDRPEQVIRLLEDAMRFPDCPTMLQNILANIHRKQGHYQRAAEVYLHIIQTSRDQAYIDTARRKLEVMGAAPPH